MIVTSTASTAFQCLTSHFSGDISFGLSILSLFFGAEKEFKFDAGKVKAVLAKHRKFDPAEWEVYIAELKAAFEQPA